MLGMKEIGRYTRYRFFQAKTDNLVWEIKHVYILDWDPSGQRIS